MRELHILTLVWMMKEFGGKGSTRVQGGVK